MKPARKGNAPRLGGYVAWRNGNLLERRGARGEVVRCGTGSAGRLLVSVQGGDPIQVDYRDVYPCEGPA